MPDGLGSLYGDFGTLAMKERSLFFTRVGRIFAHVTFWSGTLGIFYTVGVGLIQFKYPEELMAQSKWMANGLNEGVKVAFVGLALGVLCEISSRKNKPDDQA